MFSFPCFFTPSKTGWRVNWRKRWKIHLRILTDFESENKFYLLVERNAQIVFKTHDWKINKRSLDEQLGSRGKLSSNRVRIATSQGWYSTRWYPISLLSPGNCSLQLSFGFTCSFVISPYSRLRKRKKERRRTARLACRDRERAKNTGDNAIAFWI